MGPRQVVVDPMQVDEVMTTANAQESSIAPSVNLEQGAIAGAMLDHVRPLIATSDMIALTRSCHFFRNTFQPYFDKLALPALYQAIIDDNREQVKRMLNGNPWLLLCSLPDNSEIESKLTWQKFKLGTGDSPLSIAAKRKQIEMVNVLLPYYDRLKQDIRLSEETRQHAREVRDAGLKAWSLYEMRKDEIVIPKEYTDYVNNLIDVFSRETLAPGLTDFTQLSDNAEVALRSLLNLLVPKTAIELNNHIDVELLLLAAYQLYDNRFNDFTSWEQRDAFCIRVIGLIQSVLTPETAKIFCEGLYDIINNINNKQLVGERAALKLYGGESFYRADRASLSGLGGKYLCGASGAPVGRCARDEDARVDRLFYKLCQTKNNSVSRLMPRRRNPEKTQCAVM